MCRWEFSQAMNYQRFLIFDIPNRQGTLQNLTGRSPHSIFAQWDVQINCLMIERLQQRDVWTMQGQVVPCHGDVWTFYKFIDPMIWLMIDEVSQVYCLVSKKSMTKYIDWVMKWVKISLANISILSIRLIKRFNCKNLFRIISIYI